MSCHDVKNNSLSNKGDIKRILLMGNPNVGKSVVFSRLTGVGAIASNYPGTTVHYTRGLMKVGEERDEVIDVPGTYTLEVRAIFGTEVRIGILASSLTVV